MKVNKNNFNHYEICKIINYNNNNCENFFLKK